MVKIKEWFQKPMNAKPMTALFAIWLAIAYVTTLLLIRPQDCDTFYMIQQGNDILNSGFPKTNDYLFFDDFNIIVQQWLYCVMLALVSNALGLWGRILFALAQGMILFWLIERRISKYNKDKFWSCLFACIVCFALNLGYYTSTRPENMTLILLMLDCMVLDKYKETKKAYWLYLLPLITLAEINLHASMWPFHFCILLANVCPPIFKKSSIDDHIRIFEIQPDNNHIKTNWHMLIAITLMAASLFLNPYGLDNITYVFKSMSTFKHIPIVEQQLVGILTSSGLYTITMLVIVAVAIKSKKLTGTTIYMNMGFLFLACTSYHSAMFLTIAGTYLACDLLKILAEKSNNKKVASYLPNGVWVIAMILTGYFVGFFIFAIQPAHLDEYIYDDGSLKAIADYIKAENPDRSPNVLNTNDAGSQLEYFGIRNLYADSRPEMLSKKINGKADAMETFYMFAYGTPPETFEPNTIQDFLDKYDIEYIVTFEENTMWIALRTYVTATGQFTQVELEGVEKPKFALYERSKTWQTTANQ